MNKEKINRICKCLQLKQEKKIIKQKIIKKMDTKIIDLIIMGIINFKEKIDLIIEMTQEMEINKCIKIIMEIEDH